MGRLVLAGALVIAAAHAAAAKPTRKVYIETDPAGAAVYLDDVDRDPVCKRTPCTIDAPIGESTIVIRLDNYEPEIAQLDVRRGKGKLTQKYKLRGAVAVLIFDTPKGATI